MTHAHQASQSETSHLYMLQIVYTGKAGMAPSIVYDLREPPFNKLHFIGTNYIDKNVDMT